MHRITSIAIALVAALSLAAVVTAFDAARFQSVGGDYGQSLISQFEAQDQKDAAQVEEKSLWGWGGAPKGYKVQNGSLVARPDYYLYNGTYYDATTYNNLLNNYYKAQNWLGDVTYDPYADYAYQDGAIVRNPIPIFPLDGPAYDYSGQLPPALQTNPFA